MRKTMRSRISAALLALVMLLSLLPVSAFGAEGTYTKVTSETELTDGQYGAETFREFFE